MTNITVENMTSAAGNAVPNQFVITHQTPKTLTRIFQSYKTTIAKKKGCKITLDRDMWDYSVTTMRYLKTFTGYNAAETRKLIASGEIKLANLN